MFQNLSILAVTVTTFLLKPKFSDSVPSQNQGRLQAPERLCPDSFASSGHVEYVHCQVHFALLGCSHARQLFLPVYSVVPTSFGGLSGQSHLVASKLKSQGSKLATFLSILSPGLYLVSSQDDKGVLISKQQNPRKEAGNTLKEQLEDRGWSLFR